MVVNAGAFSPQLTESFVPKDRHTAKRVIVGFAPPNTKEQVLDGKLCSLVACKNKALMLSRGIVLG
jgi:hypothetical protein